MVDKSDNKHVTHFVSKFVAAGIPLDTLANAADVAKGLCAQSGPVDGGTLEPHHFIDYQRLFLDFARKASR